MIKKSIIVFVLVLIVHIVIRDILKPDVEITQAPWQANQQIGQRYLYSDTPTDNVLTGSSMSFHLDLDGTIEKITNLSFSGESAHKAISLVIEKGRIKGLYPKRIYIEINTLDNYGESTFEETIYNPFLIYPREYVPALRDGKQPLTWMATIFEKYITPYVIPHRYTLLEDVLKVEEKASTKTENIDIIPNERLKIDSLSLTTIQGIENKLVKELDILIMNNCEPVFFEMPVADHQRNSPKYASIRQIIEKNYPSTKYKFIRYSMDSNFQTYDGFHLTAEDNPRYSAYLRSAMDSISSSSNK